MFEGRSLNGNINIHFCLGATLLDLLMSEGQLQYSRIRLGVIIDEIILAEGSSNRLDCLLKYFEL